MVIKHSLVTGPVNTSSSKPILYLGCLLEYVSMEFFLHYFNSHQGSFRDRKLGTGCSITKPLEVPETCSMISAKTIAYSIK